MKTRLKAQRMVQEGQNNMTVLVTISHKHEKKMDELKNVMKEKKTKNLGGMVKRTNLPFTMKVLECPLPPKFPLPQLELYDGLKDSLDHITTFKMTLSLQQTPNEIVCGSFPMTLKGAARV